ncbi:MAG TPA: hypothetical protein VMU59_05405 [Caulobacteraceae bacterium]|nr:hypothetical protein [Caulobacteraceae bacterium]
MPPIPPPPACPVGPLRLFALAILAGLIVGVVAGVAARRQMRGGAVAAPASVARASPSAWRRAPVHPATASVA